MPDREKVIKALEYCKETCGGTDCPYWNGSMIDGTCILKLHADTFALLKEQEEQKQKWLKQIADAQIAVCPTGIETEEGLAKRTGKWIGLQMAWDILTNGR